MAKHNFLARTFRPHTFAARTWDAGNRLKPTAAAEWVLYSWPNEWTVPAQAPGGQTVPAPYEWVIPTWPQEWTVANM